MDRKTRIKRITSAFPAILLMIIIFIYSSKTAVESSASSDPIAETVLKFFERFTGRYPDEIRFKKLDLCSAIVRKTAHVCEYALLSIFVCIHLYISKYHKKVIFTASILISILYACTDEFHQTFVSGRSGRIVDVLIDSAGVLIGAAGFIFFVNKKADLN